MFTAPQMWQLIEYYDNGISDVMKLDVPSQALLLKLFDAAGPIAPDENGHKKRFYFYLPKGSFEDYKKLHDGTEAQLRDWYNHETDGWFDCMLIYQQLDWEDEPFYGVYINDMYVLSLHDRNEVEWPETDATEFIEGLISIVNDVVQMLKKGVYNDWVKENLAYHLRVGTISRHAYWEVYPEEKTKYALSEHEKQVLMLEKPTTTTVPKTAREFYEACAVCYRAVGLDDGGTLFTDTDEEHRRYGGVTPKELYYRYADGRDDGLQTVDLDSEEEFQRWLKHEPPYTYAGGHPFEIMFSFTGQHSIHLYLMDGHLYLTGGAFPANMTACKMYVALIDHGYAVEFANRDSILLRIEEKDVVGIKPWFSYYGVFDDDENVLDMIELDSDSYPKLKDKIQWKPVRKTYLLN